MADDLTLDFSGLADLQSKLEAVGQAFGTAAFAALREEAEVEMTEAKSRTPVKTGILRDSGEVTGPDDFGAVKLSFGGAASGYAIEVHENMEMFHPRGGQAKFLESVILESAPYLAQRIAERIEIGAGGEFAPTKGEVRRAQAATRSLNKELSGE